MRLQKEIKCETLGASVNDCNFIPNGTIWYDFGSYSGGFDFTPCYFYRHCILFSHSHLYFSQKTQIKRHNTKGSNISITSFIVVLSSIILDFVFWNIPKAFINSLALKIVLLYFPLKACIFRQIFNDNIVGIIFQKNKVKYIFPGTFTSQRSES